MGVTGGSAIGSWAALRSISLEFLMTATEIVRQTQNPLLPAIPRRFPGFRSSQSFGSRTSAGNGIRHVLLAFACVFGLLATGSDAWASVEPDSGCAANLTVTNANDSGSGSLRAAVNGICSDGEIDFSDRFEIQLASEIVVDKRFRLSGNNVANAQGGTDHALVQIKGSAGHRIFRVDASGDLYLEKLRLSNGVLSGGDAGGAIRSAGIVSISACRFDGNRSGSDGGLGGGAIYSDLNANLFVETSTFDGNTSQRGAAIFSAGLAELYNSTFSGNSADNNSNVSEGTIQNRGTLTAIHITVTNNDSALFTSSVGGLFAFNANTTLINSIFADNLGNDCQISGGTFSSVALLRQTGNCARDFSGDPLLGSLADNGGFTPTHALGAGSAALGAGDVAFCLASDQRGVARTQPGTCDLGAIEQVSIFSGGFE
jgi:hypothetical protein